ncbi:hypothetical protein HAX54_037921 [Datura stramonium]|uniref:Uncharacterized protein n=1 Tax=Datura stramonium TaxID=4076 RepID=A0ABS8SHP2_DATST|nr:hypothetical protein [Datura stramonium]
MQAQPMFQKYLKSEKTKSDRTYTCTNRISHVINRSVTFIDPGYNDSVYSFSGYASLKFEQFNLLRSLFCFVGIPSWNLEEQEADAESTDLPYSRSTSLPTALKLVSAIKGSREKQGKPPKKLSVTWAPDVYDPIPTAVSHVPNKVQRHRSDHRKNGKNKQKSNGKSSRGSKGKDKKQGRKHGASTKRSCYHPLEDNHTMTCSSFHSLEDNVTAHSSGLQAGAVDYDIGSTPDPFCGSSFLKKSVTKLHFPVAEAS